jgi:signal transduction histidine kinase
MSAPQIPSLDSTDQHLTLLDELARAERRALGFEIASAIAHMIGTPLHVVAGRASLIRGAPDDASVADNARRIEEQVERLAERMRAFIAYLTLPESASAPEPAHGVVETALTLCATAAKARGVSFELDNRAPAASVVTGSSTLLVLTRLLASATRIAPTGAACSLEVEVTEDGRLAFSLGVPGLGPFTGRLESLEPTVGPENLPREELQSLAFCAAIARRKGGSVEVVGGAAGRSTIRFVTARTG